VHCLLLNAQSISYCIIIEALSESTAVSEFGTSDMHCHWHRFGSVLDIIVYVVLTKG